jgi:dethiobiotin synthetase
MNRPPLIFIAGTDTGVGKTLVTGLLAAALDSRGVDVAVVKAVQTGCTEAGGRMTSPDLAVVATLAGWPEDDDRLHLGAGFGPACSPHLAARMAGTHVEESDLDATLQRAAASHACVLVEGAGGLMTPLRDDLLFIDWIARRRAPVLLVARAGLGTLNHTLLSAEAMRHRGIPLAGVVLNDLPPSAEAWLADDNAATLVARLDAPVARLPSNPPPAAGADLLDALGW